MIIAGEYVIQSWRPTGVGEEVPKEDASTAATVSFAIWCSDVSLGARVLLCTHPQPSRQCQSPLSRLPRVCLPLGHALCAPPWQDILGRRDHVHRGRRLFLQQAKVFVCDFMCVRACVGACVRACVCICMSVCAYVCVCVCVCVCVVCVWVCMHVWVVWCVGVVWCVTCVNCHLYIWSPV